MSEALALTPQIGARVGMPDAAAITLDAPGRYDIAAVGRAIDVLMALGQIGPATLTAIAGRAGCTRTAAFRLLRTLHARGFVTQEGHGGLWRLGTACVRLRGAAEKQLSLSEVARPAMAQLASLTGENVYLRNRLGLRTALLATHQAQPALHLLADPPAGGPLHAGAGRMLLAHAPMSVLDQMAQARLPRFTPETRTEMEPLLAEASMLRIRGVLRAANDLYANVVSIAAPVRDASGAVIAVLEVSANTWRMPEKVARLAMGHVVAQAQALSAELGAVAGDP